MTKIYKNPRDLLGQEGTTYGPSSWLLIDQERVDGFAKVTGDDQWIHVDPEKAKDGPFGGTIAHGYLTMSLVNYFLPEMIDVQGFTHGVNLGTDRVRFVTPVPTGSEIRATSELLSAEEKKGSIQAIFRITVEIKGQEKPACIVDSISRYYPED